MSDGTRTRGRRDHNPHQRVRLRHIRRSQAVCDRLAVAAGCRDRAAAKADGPAAAELASVDPRQLRDELDAAFSLFRNQPRPVGAICERQLPFVTPGLTLSFEGAEDGGVEFTYETNSDKP